MTPITPLVICGGNGTRLWPMSRTESPKQFQRIGDDASATFFQAAVLRHRGPGFGRALIVSSVRHRNTVAAQLAQIGCDADRIYEPMGRNTGPAVLAAALTLHARDPNALMLVVPADHVIEGEINATILAMAAAASEGRIVTFGIKPRYAETGFGYITDGGPIPEHPGLHEVSRFVEKPPIRKARLLVESDVAYWASGISLFSAATIIEEYRKFDPHTHIAVREALAGALSNARGTLLNPDHFRHAANLATEQVVFEKTRTIALAPLDVQWSDVGSWSAMYGISRPNAQGNVLQGDVIAVETKNSLVRSDTRLVSVVGLSDVIIIDTPDALLVTRVGHCQNVKKVAEHLKAAQRREAEKHDRSDHDWGSCRQLVAKNRMNLSSLTIHPGAGLDLDPAGSREVTMVAGTLHLSSGKVQTVLSEGERAQLNTGAITRIVNRTDAPAEAVIMTLSADLALIDCIAPLGVGGCDDADRPLVAATAVGDGIAPQARLA